MFQFVIRKPRAQELRSFSAAAAADRGVEALTLAYQLASTTPEYANSMPLAERATLDEAIVAAIVTAHEERRSILGYAAKRHVDLSESDLASETDEIAHTILRRLATRHAGGPDGLN